jgi:hypothetical protein
MSRRDACDSNNQRAAFWVMMRLLGQYLTGAALYIRQTTYTFHNSSNSRTSEEGRGFAILSTRSIYCFAWEHFGWENTDFWRDMSVTKPTTLEKVCL